MAGNHNSGRRAQTVDRRIRLDPADVPRLSTSLGSLEREYWLSSVAPADHLRACDADLAVECCRLYGLYRRAVAGCEKIPLDNVAARTALQYHAAWIATAKRLGLDPASRKEFAKTFVRESPAEAAPDIRFFEGAG